MADFPPKMAIAADICVVTKENDYWHIVLIKRKNPPYQDNWALPGGFVELDEAVENAAKRELQEETSIKVAKLTMLGGYSKPGRDPRGRTLSFVYYFVAENKNQVTMYAGDDAKEAEWFKIDDLSTTPLAFDHQEIIKDLQQALFQPTWRQSYRFK